jgi:nucleotide-binding universal stress UspA family protein
MIIPEIKKILYATDLSDNARYAFAYAVRLANLFGAGLTLLHVLPEVPESLDAAVEGYINTDKWEEIKQRHFNEAKETLTRKRRDHVAIKEVLDHFCEEAKSGKSGKKESTFVTDDILVVWGNPVEQILLQADEKNCDLIVMGTHGRGSLADAMIGSTARRVVRRSEKPVLVIRLPEESD